MRRMKPTEVRALMTLFGGGEGTKDLATKILRLVNEMRAEEKTWVVQVFKENGTIAMWGPFQTAKQAHEALDSGRINAVTPGTHARLWVLVDSETGELGETDE